MPVEEGEPPDEDTNVLKACGIDNLVNKVKPTNKPTEKDRKLEITKGFTQQSFFLVYIGSLIRWGCNLIKFDPVH